jgi:hypothetical protein
MLQFRGRQLRLSARLPRLLQADLAVLAVFLHPTAHGLPDYMEATGDFGLVQVTIKQM